MRVRPSDRCGKGRSLVAVVHREYSTLPSAVEIEVTLPLADIEDSDFQEPEPQRAVVGAAPI